MWRNCTDCGLCLPVKPRIKQRTVSTCLWVFQCGTSCEVGCDFHRVPPRGAQLTWWAYNLARERAEYTSRHIFPQLHPLDSNVPIRICYQTVSHWYRSRKSQDRETKTVANRQDIIRSERTMHHDALPRQLKTREITTCRRQLDVSGRRVMGRGEIIGVG